MNQAHVALSHEAAQSQESADVGGASHRDGFDRKRRRQRLGAERAVGLTGDQRAPAVGKEPANLGERADLLTPVPAGRLGVQDGLHEGRLPPCALERKNAGG